MNDSYYHAMLSEARQSIQDAVNCLKNGSGEMARKHRVQYNEKVRSFCERAGVSSFEEAIETSGVYASTDDLVAIRRLVVDYDALLKKQIAEISASIPNKPGFGQVSQGVVPSVLTIKNADSNTLLEVTYPSEPSPSGLFQKAFERLMAVHDFEPDEIEEVEADYDIEAQHFNLNVTVSRNIRVVVSL